MHPVPPCIFHILPLCEFYYLLICHKGTSVLFLLLLPTTGIPRSSFWQVQVPYTKSQFQRSRILLGRANTISSLFLLLTPRKSLSVPPLSPCFIAPAFPLFLSFLLLLSCIPQTYLWTVSPLGFLLYPSILSRLRYSTLLRLSPFSYFLPYSPISYGWQPLFGMFLTYIAFPTTSRLSYLFEVRSCFCS